MSINPAQSLSSTPEQASTPEGHSASDIQEAIRAMGGTPDAPDTNAILDEEQGQKAPEKAPVPPPKDFDFDLANKTLEQKRKQYMVEKKHKETILNLQQQIDELKGGKSKDHAKKPQEQTRRSNDDIIDELISDPDNEYLTPKELAKKVKDEVLAEIKKGNDEERTKSGHETEVAIFKEEINDYVEQNGDKHPLTIAFGHQEEIFSLIEQDYERNVKQYGEEYANENIMKKEKAAAMLENYLAQQMKTRLKSKGINKALRSYLSDDSAEESEQSSSKQSSSPRTLSNGFGQNVATSDDGPDEWNARLKWAANKYVK